VKIGKLNHQDLRQLVLDRLPEPGSTVASGPSIGLDCAAIRFGDGQVVLSTDPITGAAAGIGRLAVHISCNDIAACGIRPAAMLLVVIAPPDASREEIRLVVDQAAETASQLSVSIIGGHTEISDAVSRFVVTTTALGFTYGDKIIQASGGQAGDSLVMTKTAGLEGTAILASDKARLLRGCLSAAELAEASALIGQISVIAEGSCGARVDVHAMHDATEGGILGACWELAEASKLGCIIEPGLIPLHPLTRKICDALNLDPMRLIASGSLILAAPQPEILLAELQRKGITGTVIGRLTESPYRLLAINGARQELLPPGPDELYKIT
jgi:hydrogenase expression/formation protein HypE